MEYININENGYSFTIEKNILSYDDYKHFIYLIASFISKIHLISVISDETIPKQWFISYKKYDRNHKLDFNYAKFTSNNVSFELIREYGINGYSAPKVVNFREF